MEIPIKNQVDLNNEFDMIDKDEYLLEGSSRKIYRMRSKRDYK